MNDRPAHEATPGAQRVRVDRVRAGVASVAEDWVAEEVPVALAFNGISHAVMLATPLDLEDFALGFALGEGILDDAGQLYEVDEEPSAQGITMHLRVAGAAFARLKDKRRSMAGRTGCGLCGTESLDQVTRVLPGQSDTGLRIAPAAIVRAMAGMADHQTLQKTTGAVHAAAWCTADGDVVWVREDVGRHNALDKLVGALARHKVHAGAGFFAVTSRASFEMVQKTAVAGVSLIAAVSAPTALAIATAQGAGVTLVGFARQQNLSVYSHAGRLDAL